jgi:hypothetical protein
VIALGGLLLLRLDRDEPHRSRVTAPQIAAASFASLRVCDRPSRGRWYQPDCVTKRL